LADPCDTPPALTIKHLYIALFRIIQTGLTGREEIIQTKEILRKIEKSRADDDQLLAAAIQWLAYMDQRNPPSDMEAQETGIASKLIDWAVTTPLCREELDSNIEKLKTLKSETTATLRKLKIGTHLSLSED
jgi:hypothetical protein